MTSFSVSTSLRPLSFGAFAVDDHRHRVHLLFVDQNVELDERRRLKMQEMIIERRVAPTHRFQSIEEVEHDFGERQLELEGHLPARVLEFLLSAALLDAELNDVTEMFLRHQDAREDDRLANLLDTAGSGRSAGFSIFKVSPSSVSTSYTTVGAVEIKDKLCSRSRRSWTISMCSRPEKAAPKAEAQRAADLGLEDEGCVIEGELLQRLTKSVELFRGQRKEAGEHARLNLLETG